MDYSTYSQKDMDRLVRDLEPHALQNDTDLLPPAQMGMAITSLRDEKIPDWKERLKAIYFGSNTDEQLEEAGKQLNVKQALLMLDATSELDTDHHWRLLPLLVGMPHQIFLYSLLNASDHQLQTLQNEGLGEPVQHHLTVLIHDLQRESTERDDALKLLEEKITSIDPNIPDEQTLHSILLSLKGLTQNNERLLTIINRSLALAWNTNRIDLVDKLNDLKEQTLKNSNQWIGYPKNKHGSSGLYEHLENKLSSVFGDPSNEEDIEALHDHEPSIEALTKWSLWYVKDYWEIGLLPKIKEEELEVPLEEQEKLVSTVRNNLEKVGLGSVGDLKAKHLYTKNLLQRYLSKHQSLMS